MNHPLNPDLSDPADAPVKSLQNHTYYHDVCVFVERLEDLQAIKGEDLVPNNIHASLRGSALDWYTVELTDFERQSLLQLPLYSRWMVYYARQQDEISYPKRLFCVHRIQSHSAEYTLMKGIYMQSSPN